MSKYSTCKKIFVLYFDSMNASYVDTILEAVRESGRSEREVSRSATGQPTAIAMMKTGRAPSAERVRQFCAALGLEFYVGPARGPPEGAAKNLWQYASVEPASYQNSLAIIIQDLVSLVWKAGDGPFSSPGADLSESAAESAVPYAADLSPPRLRDLETHTQGLVRVVFEAGGNPIPPDVRQALMQLRTGGAPYPDDI